MRQALGADPGAGSHGKMIVIEAARAKKLPAASVLAKRELNRFLSSVKKELGLAGEFSVLLTGDEPIRAMNLKFRGVNKPTDVLSFPSVMGTGGDLAISLETAAVQAAAHGHSLQIEVKILLLHGFLHLAGYDHEQDLGQMRRRENLLRRQFDLPVGLLQRSHKRAKP